MANIIVGGIVLLVVGLAIWSLRKKSKSGGS